MKSDFPTRHRCFTEPNEGALCQGATKRKGLDPRVSVE